MPASKPGESLSKSTTPTAPLKKSGSQTPTTGTETSHSSKPNKLRNANPARGRTWNATTQKWKTHHFKIKIIALITKPGAGTDSPQGTKFWCQQKHLVTSFICCKFQKCLWNDFIQCKFQKCLWNDFIQFFFFFFFSSLIHVYSPGAGVRQPPGDNVLMITETSCHFGPLLLVPNHRRQ